jgi:hypothetical protein
VTKTTFVWRGYAVVAAALALLGVGHWLWAITLRGPVMYGEGAVAHAAILARDGLEYMIGASSGDSVVRPIFTAANYPPLFFHLAGIGDPFVTGRVISVVATLFVAAAIAWRARPAGWLVAITLALAWLGSVPVLQWGSALKPDLLALGLTVGAVMALDRAPAVGRGRTTWTYVLSGALIGLAAMSKPTALLPALALFAYVARHRPFDAVVAAVSGLATALVVALLTHGPDRAVLLHVIDWNALPWRVELAAPLVFFALLVLAVPIATIVLTRPSTTVVTAYAVGAVAILLLGGREGATINYFLDLSASLALALAGRAPLLSQRATYPLAALGQAAVAVLVFNPFGVVPGLPVGTGAWGEPDRIAAVSRIDGRLLVEDSGLLIANGREPLVDDIFLWSRLRQLEVSGQTQFLEGDRLLKAARDGVFDAVVSEVDLDQVAAIGGFRAQRWHPDLVAAIRERYVLRDRILPSNSGQGRGPLYVYARR